MAVFIHREPQLHKSLTKLRRAGGRAALAAARVEEIIAALAANTGIQPQQVNKLTRHGEARIEHCKKFDLVGGYRLVYVKEANHYFFLFAGTHDDCHRLLNNNRHRKPEPDGVDMPLMVRQADDAARSVDHNVPVGDMDYDAIVLKPTVSPLLTSITSRNVLLLQSLPNSIPYRQDNGRRRKDDTCVGTATRSIVERWSRVP